MKLNRYTRRRLVLLGGFLSLWIGAFSMPGVAAGDYVGAKRCRVCHMPQAKAWQETKMAKAFELLKPGVAAEAKQSHDLDPNKDYTTDAACVGCHSTGYGEGGFESIAATPELAGVTCEACHGPGVNYLKPNLMSLSNKEYKRADLVAAGFVVPTAETCQKCHNEKSPFYEEFDFEQRKADGTHKHFPLKWEH